MMFNRVGMRETYDWHYEHILRQKHWRDKRAALLQVCLKNNGRRIRARITHALRMVEKHKAEQRAEALYATMYADETHRYLFTLATRCNYPILGDHSTMFVASHMLYGIKGWYFVHRTYLRVYGWNKYD